MRITLYLDRRISEGEIGELLEVSGGYFRSFRTIGENEVTMELERCDSRVGRKTFESYDFIKRVEVSNL